jgi:triosephosphate isomerase
MQKLIIANWKMTPQTETEAENTFLSIQRNISKMRDLKAKIVVCPPFVWLPVLNRNIRRSSKVVLGAQDVFWEKQGSYTGEISIPMLKNLGAKYVIIGHSERRHYLKSDNEIINKKVKAVLKSNLKAVFCIGETERDEGGDYLKFVKKEIVEGLSKIPRKDLKNLVIAYEPIWAISSSKNSRPDTPEDLFQMTIYIRRVLFSRFGRKIAKSVPIIYGGSVKASNVFEFLDKGNVSGVLVGRASFKADTFTSLIKATV